MTTTTSARSEAAQSKAADTTPAAIRMRWSNLLFLHFAYEPEEVARLLPPGLLPETFELPDGREICPVGLIFFQMQNVRPAFIPSWIADRVPGASHSFPETNVRTYVRDQNGRRGVYFFSLDAANGLAVGIARRFFNLPYIKAEMSVTRQGSRLTYSGTRQRSGETYHVEAVLSEAPTHTAEPNSFEEFVLERYNFLTPNSRSGAGGEGPIVRCGTVSHETYQLGSVEDVAGDWSQMLAAAGFAPSEIIHTAFVEEVEVIGHKLA